MSITLGTVNICNNPDMPRRFVREDAQAAAVCHVVGFQEIGEDEDKEDVVSGLEAADLGRGFTLTHTHLPIPIAYRHHKFTCLDEGVMRMHKGLPGATPSRYIAWVVLQRRRRPFSEPFIFVNTHFVSGAWNRKEKPHKEQRKALWGAHWSGMREMVLGWQAQGLTVIVAGDWNRTNVEPLHCDWRWIAGEIDQYRGIDKIGLLEAEGGATVERLSEGRIAIRSDHDLRTVQVRIR